MTPSTTRDHPRSRGEYVVVGLAGVVATGSSPLSRGIRCCTVPLRTKPRIIPALAGNKTQSAAPTSATRDHPRSLGEYRGNVQSSVLARGSSPLSRGILWWRRGRRWTIRIIPALAGNTRWSRPIYGPRKDHPRSRGEYPVLDLQRPCGAGSSPLSRGRLGCSRNMKIETGNIPDLAGNTR